MAVLLDKYEPSGPGTSKKVRKRKSRAKSSTTAPGGAIKNKTGGKPGRKPGGKKTPVEDPDADTKPPPNKALFSVSSRKGKGTVQKRTTSKRVVKKEGTYTTKKKTPTPKKKATGVSSPKKTVRKKSTTGTGQTTKTKKKAVVTSQKKTTVDLTPKLTAKKVGRSRKNTGEDQAYTAERREHGLRGIRAANRSVRDIFPIDFTGINWERRLSCKYDLQKFGDTYLNQIFYLPPSDDHMECCDRMQTVFLEGGMFALAMPRGQGKTAWCRASMIWGTAYAHKTFPFFVGSMKDKATQTLEAVKMFWYQSPDLRQDFPEIAVPIVALENRWHLAQGQLYNGNPTHIEWGSDTIRYPSLLLDDDIIELFEKEDPDYLRYVPHLDRKVVKSSGILIRTSGIDGSIRGEADVHPLTLEQPRPDVVLLDDIQKDQKAESPTSCEKIVRLIDGAIAGLAGPDKMISCIMPCTVIREDDVSDTYLDPDKKPEWNGKRCSMVTSWPEGMDDYIIDIESVTGGHWIRYQELRKQSLRQFKDIRLATEYYKDNQEVMDDGFVCSWDQRYNKDPKLKGNIEISAQQNAMNKRFTAPATFPAEFQNNPKNLDENQLILLTPAQVAERTIAVPRSVPPIDATKIVCHIDVQNEVLFYTLFAFKNDYTGVFIEYDTFPSYRTRYFSKSMTQGWMGLSRLFFEDYPQHRNLGERHNNGKLAAPLEAKIYHALDKLTTQLLSRKFTKQDQHQSFLMINKIGIDTQWGKTNDVIRRFIREKGDPRIIPMHGEGIGPHQKQYEEYNPTKGWLFEHQLHPNVEESKWLTKPNNDGLTHMAMDVNRLKSFLFVRLASPAGTSGAIYLHEGDPARHEMFADHVAGSEEPEIDYRKGRQGYRSKELWVHKETRPDNDYLDNCVGCLALASLEGATLRTPESMDKPIAPPAPKRKLSDIYAAKQEARRSRRQPVRPM